MGYFYFDESIHSRAGFTLGAFVYSSEPLEPHVEAALDAFGLKPGIDEYKSRTRADSNPALVRLRDRLRGLIDRLALVVVPSADRQLLGRDALLGLQKILAANALLGSTHVAYFDQGIFRNQGEAESIAAEVGINSVCLIAGADSREVGGIQVADLAAHTMATMLLEQLGHVTKTVKAGENSGYDPALDINIGFELWTGLRYRFFRRPRTDNRGSEAYDPVYDVSSCGLFVSERCDESLASAAEQRFGVVYLGCIH